MEYYSAIKHNRVVSFMVKWLELEYIMLSETGQMQKDK
jgi:hypothetical protein